MRATCRVTGWATARSAPVLRARSVARDRGLPCHPGPADCPSAIFVPWTGYLSNVTGLLKWNRFELALIPQHDHRFAVLVFGPGLHLVAREFEGNATGLVVGPRKAQRIPVHGYPAATDTEKTAEVDDRDANLPAPINHDIDYPTHIFSAFAANLLAEDS